MKNLHIVLFTILAICSTSPVPDTVGFQIGEVQNYSLLKTSGSSKLYQIECAEIQDGRPMKLVVLEGSHYDVGYAYGSLLGKEIIETYHTFLDSQFGNKMEL